MAQHNSTFLARRFGESITLIELLLIAVIVGIFVAIGARAYMNMNTLHKEIPTSICKSGYLFDRSSGRQIISTTGGGIECRVYK